MERNRQEREREREKIARPEWRIEVVQYVASGRSSCITKPKVEKETDTKEVRWKIGEEKT